MYISLGYYSTRVTTAMKSTATGRIPLSSDYIIAAELMDKDTKTDTDTRNKTGTEDEHKSAEIASLTNGAESGIVNSEATEIVSNSASGDVDQKGTDGQCKTS
jgi:hypothetical protein